MGAAAVCCFVLESNVQRAFAVSKWVHCALFLIVTVVTWVLKEYSKQWFLQNSWAFGYCKQAEFLETLCSGKQVAIRFSFANCAFFSAHALALLLCTREEDPRTGLHTSLWFWRCLLWAGALVGFLFVPANAVVVYAQVARVGSGLFLVFVMIEMVMWVYDVNEWLVGKERWWSWTLLVAGAVLTHLAGLALLGASYWYYAPSPGCGINIFVISFSLVVGLAMVGILFVPGRLQVAGLLTSGAVFAYTSWLLFSALGSLPPGPCKTNLVSPEWMTIIAFFLGLTAVCYSTMTLGSSRMFGGDEAPRDTAGCDDADSQLPYRPDFFHLVYALASMYMAMLYTNWNVSGNTERFELDSGWFSFWVKMGSKWFCELLYVWTVIAPAVCRHREFH